MQGHDDKTLETLRKAEEVVKHDQEKLKEDEAKVKQAQEELKQEHEKEVTINVDGDDHRVRRGEWRVSALKAELGIDPAKVLAEITPQGLKDLEDNADIKVHEGERFMTHARSGGSS